jgi:hypothetical protein
MLTPLHTFTLHGDSSPQPDTSRWRRLTLRRAHSSAPRRMWGGRPRSSTSCANVSGERGRCISVERTATTPNVSAGGPVRRSVSSRRRPARRVRRHVATLSRAKTSAALVTMLLDEFPSCGRSKASGLRRVLHDLVDGLSSSGNRFVLTSRHVACTLRCRATPRRASKSSTCWPSRPKIPGYPGSAGCSATRCAATRPMVSPRAHHSGARRRQAGLRPGPG